MISSEVRRILSKNLEPIKVGVRNILGWRTKRKLVAFAVDDYGNVRLHSRQSRDHMCKLGLKPKNRFDVFDSLETEEDLSILYDTLSSFRDCTGRHPIFTALTVVCNIDFEKQLKVDKYTSELLPYTFGKLGRQRTWELWKEGVTSRLIFPQFHGREHLSVKLLEANLAANENSTRIALENHSYSRINGDILPDIRYTAAFDMSSIDDLKGLKQVLSQGLSYFEKIFGFRSQSFNAPGGKESSHLYETLREGKVKFIESPHIKLDPLGGGRFTRSFNYLGKKNQLDQTYLVRNCLFEPTADGSIDWVSYCIRQINAAFRWNMPAIISSHRVNFCGHIDPKNRRAGINALKQLLDKIVTNWPDVEFVTTVDIGELISN